MKKAFRVDKVLVLLLVVLLIGGCLIFASAAFGLLARGQSNISSVVFNHLVLGVGAGLVALIFCAVIDYRIWRRYAPYVFGFSVFLTALVFVPHVGATLLGGRRWIVVGPINLQPSEAMKIGSVMMAAAYFTAMRSKVGTWQWGLGGFAAIIALPSLILVAQPDIGTLGILCAAVFAVFWVAGAKPLHLLTVAVGAAAVLAILFVTTPYIRARVNTFIDPSTGQTTQGYQIKQSLIAIGSGEFFGRGWGQGVQKFTYLPEPMGDSIFAVAGEELGFVGCTALIIVFLLFCLRGFYIAAHAPDMFGTLLGIGISTYLTFEAFFNIASMLGVAPLTGIPLTFVSQGGSAMLASLASAGILLSISRQGKTKGAGN
ncbi:MAG: putative peptidoglycan glycosyltransferase FtsW [Candidatus Pacebacteria bacterium]|nr:putative peptidoglycan glycosyltransferase FtsW [Candidatus Paceibacterota bacterium]